MTTVVSEKLVALTESINVAVLSQPAWLPPINVFVCVPADVKIKPFQIYGNPDGHIAILFVDALIIFTVRTNIAVLSQPSKLFRITVSLPPVVNVIPFQWYGNSLLQIVTLVVVVRFGNTVRCKWVILSKPQ